MMRPRSMIQALLSCIALAVATMASADDPRSVPVDGLAPGQAMEVVHDGVAFLVVHRTADEIEALRLRYPADALRSPSDAIVVVQASLAGPECAVDHVTLGDPDWAHSPVSEFGGFVDPCSCAIYDLTGRRVGNPCGGAAEEMPVPVTAFTEAGELVLRGRPE